jgi:ribosomal protein S12 methylthiotransferase accessory factor
VGAATAHQLPSTRPLPGKGGERAASARFQAIFDRLSNSLDGAFGSAPAHLQLRTLGYRFPMTAELHPSDEHLTIPIRLLETSVVIGSPWTKGADGPCPECLDIRWLEARPEAQREPLELATDALQFGTFPLLTDFALDLVAALSRSLSSRPPRRDPGEVTVLDLMTLSVTRHELLRCSTCPCSPLVPDTSEGARLSLRSQRYEDPSRYRLRAAEELDLPVNALINPICGVLGSAALPDQAITATAPVTGAFVARSRFGLHRIWWSGHAETYAKSELVGLLEGLERYAGQFPRRRDVAVIAAAAELAGNYLNPQDYPPYPEAFYEAHRETFARWHQDLVCSWVWGYSLRSEQPLLVPEQLVYYLDRNNTRKTFVQECSNGCAAGSTIEEAILHGLLELVERDAFLLTWYGGLVPREIDMASIESPLTKAMCARVELLGYDLRCFDIRVDTRIPVIAAVAVRRDNGLGSLCFAAGSSLDPHKAVQAAICEVASYVPSLEARLRAQESLVRSMVSDFTRLRDLEHHALLYALPEMRGYADFMLNQETKFDLRELYELQGRQRTTGPDLREDVLTVVEELVRIGSDVVVVDQTPPEQEVIGIHTVCTLAPGLLPIDFGWDRQRALRSKRLRLAPVVAGLRAEPLSDEEVNWAPHPFP